MKLSWYKPVMKVGAVFFIALVICFYLIMPQYLYGYNASIIDKIDRLTNINEPKIILVGNSNLPFGIKSELIEKKMNMPVVNLGIHGGLGNRFHENLIRGSVNEGDIVVVCHTDYAESTSGLDPVLTWVTIENHFYLWKYVPKDEWLNMIKAFPTYIKKCILNQEAEIKNIKEYDECYSRMLFNEYGDNIYSETHDEHYEFYDKYKPDIPKIDQATIDRLNLLNTYIAECGGKMYIAGYPIAIKAEDVESQKTNFSLFQDELEKSMKCEVISNYEDYFFDYSYFLNTKLHLTDEGAKLRTLQLIKDLEKIQ